MKTKKEIIEIECDICGKDISEEGYEKEDDYAIWKFNTKENRDKALHNIDNLVRS